MWGKSKGMNRTSDFLQFMSNSLFSIIPQPQPSIEALRKAQVIAHRGDCTGEHIRENTIEAFSACLGKGIWGIEFDVRWTKDDVPVVHHDESAQRIFSKDLLISQLSFNDLKKELPEIPSLEEVIVQFAPELHLMIELKTNLSYNQAVILEKLLAQLKPIDDFHLMSLKSDRFKALTQFSKNCFVAIATTNTNEMFQQVLANDLGALTGHYLLLTEKMKTTCRKKGIKAGTGFIDNKNLVYRETNRGIDWLFSNNAIEIAKLLG